MLDPRKNKTLVSMQAHNRNKYQAKIVQDKMLTVVDSPLVRTADLKHCSHDTLLAIASVIDTLESQKRTLVRNALKMRRRPLIG